MFHEDKMKKINVTLIALICVGLYGCAARQLEPIGKAYQRNQCLQIPDKAASDKCLDDLNRYERESK